MRIFLFTFVLFCSSCATMQQGSRLSEHKSQLSKAVKMNESPQDQIDLLVTSLTQMMSESLDFVDPKQGVKFINKYKKQNEKSIQSIITNLDAWLGNMSPVDKVTMVVGMVKNENVKQFIALVPKFEKKYKQIQFFSTISNKLKGMFFGE